MNMKKLQTMLDEEKWSISFMQSCDIQYFLDLDKQIGKIADDEIIEVKQLCDDHFEEKNQNSVIARYISGAVTFLTRPQEDSIAFLDLISSFAQVNRYDLVEYLCSLVLVVNESKPALRLLGECYENQKNEEKMYAVWERLIKVDYSETTLLKALADYKLKSDKQSEKEAGILYYKKLINRLIAKNDPMSIKESFPILIALIPDEFGYLIGVCERVATHVGKSYAVALLNILVTYHSENIDNKIVVYKKILEYSNDDIGARNNLVKSYKIKYKDHGRLSTCLHHSKLNDKYFKDVIRAIEDFETNIAFDKGTFIYQKSTNKIGRIKNINEKDVLIDFPDKKSKMSTDMAFKSLVALPKSHIWVLKSVVPHEKLAEKIKTDIPWALRILMSSNNDKASVKEMKNELSPSLLSTREVNAWVNAAKKELMSNPLFGVSTQEKDTFTLRSTPITFEEKQLNIFKGKKQFYSKVKVLREFILNNGDVESDSFLEMLAYFSNNITNSDGTSITLHNVSDTIISSYLLLQDLFVNYSMNFVKLPEGLPFTALYERVENVVECFKNIDDPELKKLFIEHVVEVDPFWEKTLMDLFPHYLTSFIPDTFRSNKKADSFSRVFKQSVENYRDKSQVFLYLYKNYTIKTWEKNGISSEQLLFTALSLLDYLLKLIENKKNVTENRKNVKVLMTKLFDEKAVFNYIEEGDEIKGKKAYALVDRLPLGKADLGKKIEVKHQLTKKYPNYDFNSKTSLAEEDVIPTGLFCLKETMEAKKAYLYNLQHVQLPEIAKEIGEARELGDLKENSEYKYAKEKQRMLNSQLITLNDEIERATVIDPATVTNEKVAYGTSVTLFDNKAKAEVTYKIMGAWEADPSNNVINRLAPLGSNLLNRKVGDNIKFTVNDTPFDFTVLKIEVAI
ncbi:MAG: transcription elongation factor GreA [Sphaerochaetaceae bacterium]|nr:transcription elongation factor GreA [Sphaerochaetaceae bacterium]MDC7248686.1 transcription elongation factor GreA [Sphaerochaetaceae bacterium]